MTPQSPRIYVYKITFEEVPYYYYGVHKEKKFNENYLGSPYTNKWCWEFYTPKKQILQLFDFTDEGWLEAQEVERRLIVHFYNTDKWCLNASCGGMISLDILRKNGKNVGEMAKESKIGIFGLSESEMIENAKAGGRVVGKMCKENKIGIFGLSREERVKNGQIGGKISGQTHKENKTGVFGRSKEQMTIDGKVGGKIMGERHKKEGTGIFSLTKEQLSEQGKRRAKIFTMEQRSEAGKIGGKVATSQVWECTVTGFRSNAGALTLYQRKRNIDTSNRIRIK